MKKQIEGLFPLALIGSLTLGLAPFVPHAHIWKQIMNIYHSRPMTGMDWFDLAMHGAPWVLLILSGIFKLQTWMEKKKETN